MCESRYSPPFFSRSARGRICWPLGSKTIFVPFVLFVVRINANERKGKNHEGYEEHEDHGSLFEVHLHG